MNRTTADREGPGNKHEALVTQGVRENRPGLETGLSAKKGHS